MEILLGTGNWSENNGVTQIFFEKYSEWYRNMKHVQPRVKLRDFRNI